MVDNNHPTPSAKTACGGKLKDPASFPSAIYRSQQIYFCTIACLRVFEQNPVPFMAGEIEHPIDNVE
jgi:YHS domain-containing protein